jgi:hypothetical protein
VCPNANSELSAISITIAEMEVALCKVSAKEETEFTEFFWTFSIVLYSKKHDVSETGSFSVLR